MVRTRVGYTGGTTSAPTYRQLGDHTEAFQVDFDPTRTSFAELLALFWESHRPQRPAYKRQYRAAVFWADAEQRAQVEESRERVAAQLGKPVLTDVEPLGRFWRAEDYHQKYSLRRHTDLMALFARYSPEAFADSTVAARLNGLVAGFAGPGLLEAEAEGYGLTPAARATLESLARGHGRFIRCS